VSGPASPEITHSRGQHTHGAFTCPLSPYGCDTDFKSKNEWKRHVITKHLKVGYYECSLCSTEAMRAPYRNSRKDLFSQHIRRVHLQTNEPIRPQQSAQHPALNTSSVDSRSHTRQASASSIGQVTEAVVARYGDIYRDCYKSTRNALQETHCVFCGIGFQGNNSVENWLEHVGGRHLATFNNTSAALPGFTCSMWLNDVTLQAWLVQYGEIVWNNATSSYVLAGDSNTATPTIIAGEDPDAEGEPDLDFPFSY